jgi:hypothetical protein
MCPVTGEGTDDVAAVVDPQRDGLERTGTLMRVSSPPERRRKEHARVEFLLARFGTHPVLAITTRDAEAMYEDLKRRTVGKARISARS